MDTNIGSVAGDSNASREHSPHSRNSDNASYVEPHGDDEEPEENVSLESIGERERQRGSEEADEQLDLSDGRSVKFRLSILTDLFR